MPQVDPTTLKVFCFSNQDSHSKGIGSFRLALPEDNDEKVQNTCINIENKNTMWSRVQASKVIRDTLGERSIPEGAYDDAAWKTITLSSSDNPQLRYKVPLPSFKPITTTVAVDDGQGGTVNETQVDEAATSAKLQLLANYLVAQGYYDPQTGYKLDKVISSSTKLRDIYRHDPVAKQQSGN